MSGPAIESPARVVCVGHAAFDAVYRIEALPPRPTKVRASAFDQSVGGMAANAACAIAALGGRVAFLGPVGDDEIGRRILAALREAGVDTSAVQRVPGARSSHSAIIVEANGERLIISHRGDALEAEPSNDDRPLAADVALIDVRWPAGARRLCARARRSGVPVVLDGEMGNVDLLTALVPQADHVIFSEPGFGEWLGRTPDAEQIPAALADLVRRGATLAAVTLGEHGVVWAMRAKTSDGAPRTGHLPAFPVVAVETLGAGDAFHGAYALALAEGSDPDVALRFAAAAAALRCTRRGGNRDLPTRAEVTRLLADSTAALSF